MAQRKDNKGRNLWKGEYQNKDGRYEYQYVDVKGKRRKVYSWCLTETDKPPRDKKCDLCLRKLEEQIAKDLKDEIDTFKAKQYTLDALFEEYISVENKPELKQSTRTNYKYTYYRSVSPILGSRKIDTIKKSDIRKFYNYLIHEAGYKPNSMEIVHTILHPIFAMAVDDELIRTNPAHGVMAEIKKRNDWEKPKRHSLTESEQAAFIDYMKTEKKYNHWLNLFTVLFGTGCRVGEFIGLRWEDCDFKNNVININHQLIYRQQDSGLCEFHITTPKTKAGERDIPMLPEVREALLNEKLYQMKHGFNKSEIDGYSGFIFCNRFGTVQSAHNINRAIDRIRKEYNEKETAAAEKEKREPLLIRYFTVHQIRHSFCTRLCEKEVNMKVIQDVMGHSDITTTMNIYAEATKEKKQQTFAELAGKLKIS